MVVVVVVAWWGGGIFFKICLGHGEVPCIMIKCMVFKFVVVAVCRSIF